ncbi:hypothetical protein ACF1BE_26325 [Streptomyces sp. NPDC014991]|uniref:hypothetical protein n=1 Tax=Streptomyces sp. NPDC014991 TaxID=3364935 RepID=UPI0036F94B62
MGSRRESRAWFATAARAAAESGDPQLHAWVLAREVMVPLNYGAPKAAAGLAEQAPRVAGTRPTAAATLAAAVAARAYALNHQPEQARAALKAADALMGRLSEGERSDTWLTYGEQKHRVHLSHAFTTLGDTRLAHVSQEHAREQSAPTSTVTHTLLNIDAAARSHHDGDTEQACRRTVAALTALPADYCTGLVRGRALDLYEAIPPSTTTSTLYGNYATSWPTENDGFHSGRARPVRRSDSSRPPRARSIGAAVGYPMV